MKNVYSFRSIFIFLNIIACLLMLASCSTDSFLSGSGTDSASGTLDHQNTAFLKMGDSLPINSDNPYDSAGRIHNELFETYFELQNQPQTLAGIVSRVDSIANAHSEFTSIKSSDYHAVSLARVQYLISPNDTIVSEIINDTDMTAPAKASLTSFSNYLLNLLDKEDDCNVLYDFIVSYEATVINNSLLTERDKRIILTTSSIARHTTYRAMKRPKKNTDPDWIIFVGHLVASTDGAIYNRAEAITMALVTGIAHNQ